MLTKIDEGCYLMEMPQQHYYYLGDITSSRNGNYLRSGKGICSTEKSITNAPGKETSNMVKGLCRKQTAALSALNGNGTNCKKIRQDLQQMKR